VLQEKQVRRVGGSKIIPIDVRVIAATNRDLRQLIKKGVFRQDLYYRLNVLPLRVPPLKDRKRDIVLLAKDFYESYFSQCKKVVPADAYFSRVASQLLSHDWPGNIRELQNTVEYLVNICPDRPPSPDMLSELQLEKVSLDTEGIEDVSHLILATIAEYNSQGKVIGRRSLAQALALPESMIRRALTCLQQKGLVQVSRGRNGLQVAKS
jgi:transcriptional regulator with PAS, ATPase and Fis domain